MATWENTYEAIKKFEEDHAAKLAGVELVRPTPEVEAKAKENRRLRGAGATNKKAGNVAKTTTEARIKYGIVVPADYQ